MQSAIQKIIPWVLSATAGKWLHDLTADRIEKCVSGFVLNDLRFREDCLDEISIPLVLSSGSLRQLRLIWKGETTRLHMEIICEGIDVVLSPREEDFSAENLEKILAKREYEAKLFLLEQWEAALEQKLRSVLTSIGEQQQQQQQQQQQSSSFMKRILETILDNLEVTFKDVRIRFIHPHAGELSVLCDSASVRNDSEVDDEGLSSSAPSSSSRSKAKIVHKKVSLESFSLRASPTKHSQGEEEDSNNNEDDDFLRKMNLEAQIQYVRGASVPPQGHALVALSVTLRQVQWVFREEQVFSIVEFAEWWMKYEKRSVVVKKPHPDRPLDNLRPSTHPRQWWIYLCSLLREKIRQRKAGYSEDALNKRIADRQEYERLYMLMTTSRNQSLSDPDKLRFEKIQQEHSFAELVCFRMLSLKRMADDLEQRKSRPKQKQSWGAWLGSYWATGAENSGIAENSSEWFGDLDEKLKTLPAEELQALAAGGVVASSSESASNTVELVHDVEFERVVLVFSFEHGSIQLVHSDKERHLGLEWQGGEFSFTSKTSSMEVTALVSSLQLTEHSADIVLLDGTLPSEGGNNHLLEFRAIYSWKTNPEELKIICKSQALNIRYSESFLRYMQQVSDYSAKKQTNWYNDTSQTISAYEAERKAAAAAAAASQSNIAKLLLLELDVRAPNLLVPESSSLFQKRDASQNAILINFGHFQLSTVSCSPSDETAVISGAYRVHLENIAVSLLRDATIEQLSSTHCFSTSDGRMNRSVILEELGASGSIYAVTALADSSLRSLALNIAVPPFVCRVNSNDAKILGTLLMTLQKSSTQNVWNSQCSGADIAGRILVHGVGGVNDSWSWKWTAVKDGSIYFFTSRSSKSASYIYPLLHSSIRWDKAAERIRITNEAMETVNLVCGRSTKKWLEALIESRDEKQSEGASSLTTTIPESDAALLMQLPSTFGGNSSAAASAIADESEILCEFQVLLEISSVELIVTEENLVADKKQEGVRVKIDGVALTYESRGEAASVTVIKLGSVALMTLIVNLHHEARKEKLTPIVDVSPLNKNEEGNEAQECMALVFEQVDKKVQRIRFQSGSLEISLFPKSVRIVRESLQILNFVFATSSQPSSNSANTSSSSSPTLLEYNSLELDSIPPSLQSEIIISTVTHVTFSMANLQVKVGKKERVVLAGLSFKGVEAEWSLFSNLSTHTTFRASYFQLTDEKRLGKRHSNIIEALSDENNSAFDMIASTFDETDIRFPGHHANVRILLRNTEAVYLSRFVTAMLNLYAEFFSFSSSPSSEEISTEASSSFSIKYSVGMRNGRVLLPRSSISKEGIAVRFEYLQSDSALEELTFKESAFEHYADLSEKSPTSAIRQDIGSVSLFFVRLVAPITLNFISPLKLSLSTSQYNLLLSTFSENFAEMDVVDQPQQEEVKSTAPKQEVGTAAAASLEQASELLTRAELEFSSLAKTVSPSVTHIVLSKLELQLQNEESSERNVFFTAFDAIWTFSYFGAPASDSATLKSWLWQFDCLLDSCEISCPGMIGIPVLRCGKIHNSSSKESNRTENNDRSNSNNHRGGRFSRASSVVLGIDSPTLPKTRKSFDGDLASRERCFSLNWSKSVDGHSRLKIRMSAAVACGHMPSIWNLLDIFAIKPTVDDRDENDNSVQFQVDSRLFAMQYIVSCPDMAVVFPSSSEFPSSCMRLYSGLQVEYAMMGEEATCNVQAAGCSVEISPTGLTLPHQGCKIMFSGLFSYGAAWAKNKTLTNLNLKRPKLRLEKDDVEIAVECVQFCFPRSEATSADHTLPNSSSPIAWTLSTDILGLDIIVVDDGHRWLKILSPELSVEGSGVGDAVTWKTSISLDVLWSDFGRWHPVITGWGAKFLYRVLPSGKCEFSGDSHLPLMINLHLDLLKQLSAYSSKFSGALVNRHKAGDENVEHLRAIEEDFDEKDERFARKSLKVGNRCGAPLVLQVSPNFGSVKSSVELQHGEDTTLMSSQRYDMFADKSDGDNSMFFLTIEVVGFRPLPSIPLKPNSQSLHALVPVAEHGSKSAKKEMSFVLFEQRLRGGMHIVTIFSPVSVCNKTMQSIDLFINRKSKHQQNEDKKVGIAEDSIVNLGTILPNDAVAIPPHLLFGDVNIRLTADAAEEGALSTPSLHLGHNVLQADKVSQVVDLDFEKGFCGYVPLTTEVISRFKAVADVDGKMIAGTLYLTTTCLAHFATLLGSPSRVVVPVETITSIRKVFLAGVLPKGINIETKSGTSVVFRGFESRNAVFEKISELLREFHPSPTDSAILATAKKYFHVPEQEKPYAWWNCLHQGDEGCLILTQLRLLFYTAANSQNCVQLPWKEIWSVEKKGVGLFSNKTVSVRTISFGNIEFTSKTWDREDVIERISRAIPGANDAGSLTSSPTKGAKGGGGGAKSAKEATSNPSSRKSSIDDGSEQQTSSGSSSSREPDVAHVPVTLATTCPSTGKIHRWAVSATSLRMGSVGDRVKLSIAPSIVLQNTLASAIEYESSHDPNMRTLLSRGVLSNSIDKAVASSVSVPAHLAWSTYVRLRIVGGSWSKPLQVYTPALFSASPPKNATSVLHFFLMDGDKEEVLITISRTRRTRGGGIKIRLSSRYWLISSLPDALHFRPIVIDGDAPSRMIHAGQLPKDFDDIWGNRLEVRLQSTHWSEEFIPIERSGGASWIKLKQVNHVVVDFECSNVNTNVGGNSERDKSAAATATATAAALPSTSNEMASKMSKKSTLNSDIWISLTVSPAEGSFWRTLCVFFAPPLLFKNMLDRPLMLIQQGVYPETKPVRIEPHEQMPVICIGPPSDAKFQLFFGEDEEVKSNAATPSSDNDKNNNSSSASNSSVVVISSNGEVSDRKLDHKLPSAQNSVFFCVGNPGNHQWMKLPSSPPLSISTTVPSSSKSIGVSISWGEPGQAPYRVANQSSVPIFIREPPLAGTAQSSTEIVPSHQSLRRTSLDKYKKYGSGGGGGGSAVPEESIDTKTQERELSEQMERRGWCPIAVGGELDIVWRSSPSHRVLEVTSLHSTSSLFLSLKNIASGSSTLFVPSTENPTKMLKISARVELSGNSVVLVLADNGESHIDFFPALSLFGNDASHQSGHLSTKLDQTASAAAAAVAVAASSTDETAAGTLAVNISLESIGVVFIFEKRPKENSDWEEFESGGLDREFADGDNTESIQIVAKKFLFSLRTTPTSRFLTSRIQLIQVSDLTPCATSPILLFCGGVSTGSTAFHLTASQTIDAITSSGSNVYIFRPFSLHFSPLSIALDIGLLSRMQKWMEYLAIQENSPSSGAMAANASSSSSSADDESESKVAVVVMAGVRSYPAIPSHMRLALVRKLQQLQQQHLQPLETKKTMAERELMLYFDTLDIGPLHLELSWMGKVSPNKKKKGAAAMIDEEGDDDDEDAAGHRRDGLSAFGPVGGILRNLSFEGIKLVVPSVEEQQLLCSMSDFSQILSRHFLHAVLKRLTHVTTKLVKGIVKSKK